MCFSVLFHSFEEDFEKNFDISINDEVAEKLVAVSTIQGKSIARTLPKILWFMFLLNSSI